MIVKFTQLFQNYKIEDVASIKDKMAEKIVEAGYAVEVTLESTAAEVSKKK